MKQIYFLLFFIMIKSVAFAQNQQEVIEDYQKMVVENNPAVQAKYKQYEISLQKVPQLSSLPDPLLSAGFAISPIETKLGPQLAKISVMQMFPWFGTLNEKQKKATIESQAVFANFVDERNQSIRKITDLWYDIYLIHKSISFTKQQIDIFKQLERQATIKFENNRSKMVDILRFQMNSEELSNKLNFLTGKKKILTTEFNILINRDIGEKVILTDTLITDAAHLTVVERDSLINPKIEAVNAKLKANKHTQKIAKLSGKPNIGIGLDYGIIGKPEGMEIQDGGRDMIMPMISLSIPLGRKKIRAAITESKLKQEELTMTKEAINNQLKIEHEITDFQIQQALNDVHLNESLYSKVIQALSIAKTAYITSNKDYTEILDLQNITLRYQLSILKAQNSYFKAISYRDYLYGNYKF